MCDPPSSQPASTPPRILVIGIGNEYRRDDGIGIRVARRLRGMCPSEVAVREEPHGGPGLIETWTGVDTVILVDCVRSGAKPGRIHRIDAHTHPIPPIFSSPFSTHGLSISEAVEMSRALHQLPRRLILYGVEGEDFTLGTGLSPEVEAAMPGVVALLREELSAVRAIHRHVDRGA